MVDSYGRAAADDRIRAALSGRKETIPWRHRRGQRALKRAFDLVAALGLIVPMLPVIGLTALLVRLTSPGPVLLAQTRLGLDGAPYRMLKFRSMVATLPDGTAGGRGEVTAGDARLTPIGGFIRAWRLDELPQLFHVLGGTMSLVGPRPDLPENLALYSREQMLRFAMPPGCTAWTFTRGAFENDWSTRQDINVAYVQQWSFWLDVQILVKSFLVLLAQKGTSPESSALSQFAPPGAAAEQEKQTP